MKEETATTSTMVTVAMAVALVAATTTTAEQAEKIAEEKEKEKEKEKEEEIVTASRANRAGIFANIFRKRDSTSEAGTVQSVNRTAIKLSSFHRNHGWTKTAGPSSENAE